MTDSLEHVEILPFKSLYFESLANSPLSSPPHFPFLFTFPSLSSLLLPRVIHWRHLFRSEIKPHVNLFLCWGFVFRLPKGNNVLFGGFTDSQGYIEIVICCHNNLGSKKKRRRDRFSFRKTVNLTGFSASHIQSGIFSFFFWIKTCISCEVTL